MSAPVGPFNPTSELVAVAWLSAYVLDEQGDTIESQIGTTLPKDNTAWADKGFLQASSIPGGRSPDLDVPLRLPVVQLDGWACTPGSNKPPWHLANRLLELVRLTTEAAQTGNYGKPLVVKTGYLNVRVQAAYLISEPGRVTDDPSGFARYTADLAIDWVPA